MKDRQADEKSRANEFVRLYNRLENHLRSATGITRVTPFATLVSKAASGSATVRKNLELIKDFAELRNTLIHHSGYPNQLVAVPTLETVSGFRRIVNSVIAPKKLGAFVKKGKPKVFSTSDGIVGVLKEMRSRDFSQVVVRVARGTHRILSSEGLSRWLESKINDDILALSESRVGEVLEHEREGSVGYAHRNESVDHAAESFAEPPEMDRGRLLAILVTERGRRSETPLAIVTPWDLIERETGKGAI